MALYFASIVGLREICGFYDGSGRASQAKKLLVSSEHQREVVAMAARVNRGRQKVQLVRIQNESNRQVTFSKRKFGIFKKSSELCTLTRVEMVVLITSPGNKIFSFGHPFVETIANRYLSRNRDAPANTYVTEQYLETFQNMKLEDLNAEYTTVDEELLNCRSRAEMLHKSEMINHAREQYQKALEMMNEEQLKSFEKDLKMLRGIVAHQSHVLHQRKVEVMQHNAAMEATSAIKHFFTAGCSS
ncbi:agamous-like MADS-box protein AGL62 [Argentina anserina]|uniref:agamous-like MADS-box protein AGL62 n=1 Tax=Argentina anserina TaxID=57926 RepID=UPI0021763D09|nr:agamous-like MADS-box protein AGL62 [Potentilla anserina]